MAGGGGAGAGRVRELDQTPTWAVASVCAVIVLISILMEKGLHHFGMWFEKRKKKAMFEALEKVKAELMVLGFISLLLTFGQNYIIKICITDKAADTMLPCRLSEETIEEERVDKPANAAHKKFVLDSFMRIGTNHIQRILMEASSTPHCPHGKVSLISLNATHQLHIFIFFLAVLHVVYSAITMALGRAKIRGWKEWEKETSSLDYEFSNDPARFRFTHETSFVRHHTSWWNSISVSFYLANFFRQFFSSVRKSDYLAMRHGFITVHLAPGSKFDFQKYIKRSLEDDFKVVVGIRPFLWFSAILFLLLNVKGWQTLNWMSLVPLIIILAVGMKLQAIIVKMALEIKERHAVVQGIPLVQLSDHHFWFGRPKFVLDLLHFVLFMNAFEITHFLWIWYEFGLKSCFHENFTLIIIRVSLGIGVQIMCSYITLPLYALVSQMGSHMKRSIFDDQTSKALKKWHVQAMGKKKAQENPNPNSSKSPETSPRTSAGLAPVKHMQRMKSKGIQMAIDPSILRPEETEIKDAGPSEKNHGPVMPSNTDLLTGSNPNPQHRDKEKDVDYDFIKIDL